MRMTKLTKPKDDLFALLIDDARRYRQGLSARWRHATLGMRRRLWGGGPGNPERVTKLDTKPDLLALLEDDIRQSLAALFGEVN